LFEMEHIIDQRRCGVREYIDNSSSWETLKPMRRLQEIEGSTCAPAIPSDAGRQNSDHSFRLIGVCIENSLSFIRRQYVALWICNLQQSANDWNETYWKYRMKWIRKRRRLTKTLKLYHETSDFTSNLWAHNLNTILLFEQAGILRIWSLKIENDICCILISSYHFVIQQSRRIQTFGIRQDSERSVRHRNAL
jgi:hypothetical protein